MTGLSTTTRNPVLGPRVTTSNAAPGGGRSPDVVSGDSGVRKSARNRPRHLSRHASRDVVVILFCQLGAPPWQPSPYSVPSLYHPPLATDTPETVRLTVISDTLCGGPSICLICLAIALKCRNFYSQVCSAGGGLSVSSGNFNPWTDPSNCSQAPPKPESAQRRAPAVPGRWQQRLRVRSPREPYQ